ncbi:3-isopropylmalate dehydrogenase [Globisporangium polare]
MSLSSSKIGVLPGDPEADRVLQAVGELFCHEFSFEHPLCGGAANDTADDAFNTHLPQLTITTVAVLVGSVDGPPDAQEVPKGRLEWTCWKDAETNCLRSHFAAFLRIQTHLEHVQRLEERADALRTSRKHQRKSNHTSDPSMSPPPRLAEASVHF